MFRSLYEHKPDIHCLENYCFVFFGFGFGFGLVGTGRSVNFLSATLSWLKVEV